MDVTQFETQSLKYVLFIQHKPSVGEEAKNIWIANDLANLMSKYDTQS